MRSLGKRVSILAVGLLCGLAVVFTGASILMNMSAAPTKYEVAVFVQGTTQTQNRSLSEEDIKDYIQQGYVLYGFDVNNQRVEYDPEAEDAIAISKFIELYSSVKLDRVGENAAAKEVTLDFNGGVISQDYTSIDLNNKITLNDNASTVNLPTSEHITKANHEFLGWSETDVVISKNEPALNSSITSVTYSSTADAVTYYAIWSELKTITLSANGGTLPQGEETITFTYADVYGNVNSDEDEVGLLNAKLVTPTRAGATFLGWFTANGTQVTSISEFANDFANLTSQTTLKAHWSKTITLNANEGAFGQNDMQTITFKTSDFVSADSITALKEKFPSIEKSGAVFIGWYTATVGGTNLNDIFTFEGLAAYDTLYAQWAEPKKITLNANGGTLPTGMPQVNTISYNQTFAPQDITRDGYTFLGWFTAAEGGEEVESIEYSQELANNTTLYAHWSIKTFSLTRPTETSGYEISVKADGSNDELATGAGLNYGTELTITLTLTLQDTAFSKKEVSGLDYDDSDITINGQTVIITGKVIGAVTFNIVVENATFTANGIKYEIISATEVKVSSITTEALTQSVKYSKCASGNLCSLCQQNPCGKYFEIKATHHTKLVIPSEVTNDNDTVDDNDDITYKVTQIASTATDNIEEETTKYLGYLVIPSSITVIESGAFNDCESLRTIVIDINENLQAGDNAFGELAVFNTQTRTVYLSASEQALKNEVLKNIDYNSYGNLLAGAKTIYIQNILINEEESSVKIEAVKQFQANTNLCDVPGVGISVFQVATEKKGNPEETVNVEVTINEVPDQEKTSLTGGTTYTKFILTEKELIRE